MVENTHSRSDYDRLASGREYLDSTNGHDSARHSLSAQAGDALSSPAAAIYSARHTRDIAPAAYRSEIPGRTIMPPPQMRADHIELASVSSFQKRGVMPDIVIDKGGNLHVLSDIEHTPNSAIRLAVENDGNGPTMRQRQLEEHLVNGLADYIRYMNPYVSRVTVQVGEGVFGPTRREQPSQPAEQPRPSQGAPEQPSIASTEQSSQAPAEQAPVEQVPAQPADQPAAQPANSQSDVPPIDRNKFYISQSNDANLTARHDLFGCGPTSILMALSDFGLAQPTEVARQALINEKVPSRGVSTMSAGEFPGGPKEIGELAQAHGLSTRDRSGVTDINALNDALAEGKGVIVNGGIRLQKGGIGGHFVYVAGRDSDGNYIMGDPVDPKAERWTAAKLQDFMNISKVKGFTEVWRDQPEPRQIA